MGRNGEEAYLNAATGNFIVRQRDEFLVGRGPDSAIHRTYNSLGRGSDDNGDNWQQSTDRRIFVTGSINTPGSTVRRRSGDGSEITYGWNGSAYVTSDGGGAADSIAWTGNWIWTDGDSGVTETYAAYADYWRVVRQADTSGNAVTYSYTGDKLTRISTADGGYTEYAWSGNNIIKITTASAGAVVTRTRYAYDSYNRLSSVTVDLTPEDGSVADGQSYVTTYTYVGISKLIASIGQTDGSRLDISYDGANRVTRLSQAVADGQVRTTSIEYGANHTSITDSAGQTTRLDYSPAGNIMPLEGWGHTNLSRDAALIGGAAATKYTVQSGGSWTASYTAFRVSAGETLSFGLTLQAVGSSTSHNVGLYSASETWGGNNLSTARIVSGPGQLVQTVGGLWKVTGLSATEATRIEVTRTYTQSTDSGAAYLYVDMPMNHRSGASVLVADPQLLRATGAVNLNQFELANWTQNGVAREATGTTIDGAQAYRYVAGTPGAYAYAATSFNAAKGETYSFALSLQAAGGIMSQALGLYGSKTGWGANSNATARIVSGPGTLRRATGGLWVVDGLSTTQATRIEVTRTYDSDEAAAAYFYDDYPGGFRGNGAALIAAAPNLTRRLVESPGASQLGRQLTKITLPSAQANAAPQTIQFEYNQRGDLVSVVDASGKKTSYTHDANGNVVSETDSSGNLVTRTYGSRNELLTVTRTGSSEAAASALHTTRYVYDSASRLRFVISAEGSVTEFHYDSYGQVIQQAQHTDRLINVIGVPSSMPITEAQVLEWRAGLDKSQLKIIENRYDARGNMVERATYGSANPDGSPQAGSATREYFAYDQAGQLLNRRTGGLNTQHFVYDGLGRMRSSTDLNGATTSIVFDDVNSRTVVTLASGLVQTSTYNKAGELIAFAEGGALAGDPTVFYKSAVYKYDQLGRLRVATTTPDSTRSVNSYFLYDKLGRKVADINSYGQVTEYRYDADGRVVATVSYTNTAVQFLQMLQEPNHGLEISQIRPVAHALDLWSWTVYDKRGRVAGAVDGSGAVTRYEYDASDRLVRTTAYVNKLTSSKLAEYRNSSPTTLDLPVASPADKVARNFYDKDGLLVATLDGEGYISRAVYDAAGQKVQDIAYANATRAELRATGSLNDLLANLTSTQDRATRYVYDGQGQLRFTIDALNQVSEFRYEAGLVRETVQYAGPISLPDKITPATVYKAVVDAGLADHPVNRVSRNVLDSAGRIAYSIDAARRIVGFTYDSLGQVTKIVHYAHVPDLSHLPSKIEMDAWAAAQPGDANRITRNYYSDKGELLYVIDAEGYVSRTEYDVEGRVERTKRWGRRVAAADSWDLRAVQNATQQLGAWVEQFYSYDKAGRLEYSFDGRARAFRYYANGTLQWDIELDAASGRELSRTLFTYDGAGRVIEEYRGWTPVETPEQAVTRYAYDGHGNLVSIVDPNGNRTLRSYDRLGRLVTQTDAAGGETRYSYNSFGEVWRTVDPGGNSSYSYYDQLGRLTHSRDAENYVTETRYTHFGEVESITRRYNKAGAGGSLADSPSVLAHNLDATTRYVYDRLGRKTHVRDAENHVTESRYTAFGEIESVTRRYGKALADGTPGQVPSVVSHERDATTRFEYDRLGRLVKSTDAEGYFEQYTLNAHGQRTQVRNKLGALTRYTYDSRGLLTSETLPMASTDFTGSVRASEVTNRFEYDARGNLTRKIEAEGLSEQRTTSYVYDRVGRLIETRHDPVETVNQTDYGTEWKIPTERIFYDRNGNIVQTVDKLGARTLFYYDRLNRKVEQIDALGFMTSWKYDSSGNVAEERRWANAVPGTPTAAGHGMPSTSSQDRVTTFTYDRLNRLKTRTAVGIRTGRWDGGSFQVLTRDLTDTFEYDSSGNAIRTTDANGSATHHSYDRLGRRIRSADAGNYVTSWHYDAEGNVLIERRFARPLGSIPAGGLPEPTVHADDRITEFTYDRNGRRLSEARHGIWATTVSEAGSYSRFAKSTVSYAYNGLGQVTRKIEATALDEDQVEQHATDYEFDGAGRLVREKRALYVDQNGNQVRPTVDYSYDGLSNLTRTRQSGESAAPQGERVTAYYYLAGGFLAQMWDASGARFDYHRDLAGNLLAQTWTRVRADLPEQREGILYQRDILGRVTSQALGSSVGGYWTKGDRQETQYNGFGEVVGRGLNGQPGEQFGYDRAGRLERSNTGDGVWRYYLYDGAGNQTMAIENEGDEGLVDASVDHALYRAQNNGLAKAGAVYVDGLNVTINVYDARNLAVETRMPHRQLAAGTTRNLSMGRSYNAFGEVTSETDARGNRTSFEYNNMGRRITIRRPGVITIGEDGQQRLVYPTEAFEYDLSGRLVASRDANGNRSQRELLNGTGYGQAEALVVREYHADGGTVFNQYDVFGDLQVRTDEIGRRQYKGYDAMGRLTAQRHASGLYEQYSYDTLGQRIRHFRQVSPGAPGEEAITDYDLQGRVTRQVDFGGDVTRKSYMWLAGIQTAGTGALGGWQQITTYENGLTAIERSDTFNRQVFKRDLGAHEFRFTYDQAGRMTERTSGDGTLRYDYFNTGRVFTLTAFSGIRASRDWTEKTTVYGYDEAGNLTAESTTDKGEETYVYSRTDFGNSSQPRSWNYTSQNATAEYDAHGRITRWQQLGDGDRPGAITSYVYDANGNIRLISAMYQWLDSNGEASPYASQDLWYRYDSMNRVVTAKGTQDGASIVRGTKGVDYAYNAAGERILAIYTLPRTITIDNPEYKTDPGAPAKIPFPYKAEVREWYDYNPGGALTSVRVAETGYSVAEDRATPLSAYALKAEFRHDGLGRVTRQIDYANGSTGSVIAYERNVTYNAKGQVSNEQISTRQGQNTLVSYVANQFGFDSGYALGAVISSTSRNYRNGDDGAAPDTSTANSYAWFDGALLSKVEHTPNKDNSGTIYRTYYNYNGAGHLLSAQINDGRRRTVTYANDQLGQAVRRDESDGNIRTGDPHEVWFRFGGKQMGYTGNNGTLDTDYLSSIDNRTASPGDGNFRFGSTSGSAHADFDLSQSSINSFSQGGGGGSYTVRAGESLASIAASVWGDSNLWYRLAEANGLSSTSALTEGQRITIPAGVMRNTHNASTFRPYDPAGAIGDTAPTSPKPVNGNKCGAFGMILLVAVAVAVSAITYGAATGAGWSAVAAGATSGAAGSVASQGVGVATGIQDEFDWKAVGMAAIGGGVSHGLAYGGAGNSAALSAVRAGAGALATQGAGFLLGLTDKFDWAGVAAAAAGAGAASWTGGMLGSGINPHIGELMSNTAGGIASAATLSLFNGRSFGDNLRGELPSIIGSTVGNAIATPVLRSIQRVNNTGVQCSATTLTSAGVGLSAAIMPSVVYRENEGLMDWVDWVSYGKVKAGAGVAEAAGAAAAPSGADASVSDVGPNGAVGTGGNPGRGLTVSLSVWAEESTPVISYITAVMRRTEKPSWWQRGPLFKVGSFADLSWMDTSSANIDIMALWKAQAAGRDAFINGGGWRGFQPGYGTNKIATRDRVTAGAKWIVHSAAAGMSFATAAGTLPACLSTGVGCIGTVGVTIAGLVEVDNAYAQQRTMWTGHTHTTFGARFLEKHFGADPANAGTYYDTIGAVVGLNPRELYDGIRMTFAKAPIAAPPLTSSYGAVFDDGASAFSPITQTLTYQPSSGVVLRAVEGRTTTILGRHKEDMEYVIFELGEPRTIVGSYGGNPGGFNVLNTPNSLWQKLGPKAYFEQINAPFIDAAVQRGDVLPMATKPSWEGTYMGAKNLTAWNPETGRIGLTSFGREYHRMRILHGLKYQNGFMVKP